jgi:hypothetical protein
MPDQPTSIVSMDDLVRRQQAMDAYQQRINEMQKMDFRKAKEELDQAKVEKMHADVFKTKVSTQKTIIDAQSALQQIQMKQQMAQQPQPQQQMQVQASRQGYAGFSDGKLGVSGVTSMGFQMDGDKLKGRTGNLPQYQPMKNSDYYTRKNAVAEKPKKLMSEEKRAGVLDTIKNAIKMENSLGWALMPGMAGGALGAAGGALYSGFDPEYMKRDMLTGAIIGGGIGSVFGHNYGKNKLRDMLGGTLDPGMKAFSRKEIKAMTPDRVEGILKARKDAAAADDIAMALKKEEAMAAAKAQREAATAAAREAEIAAKKAPPMSVVGADLKPFSSSADYLAEYNAVMERAKKAAKMAISTRQARGVVDKKEVWSMIARELDDFNIRAQASGMPQININPQNMSRIMPTIRQQAKAKK